MGLYQKKKNLCHREAGKGEGEGEGEVLQAGAPTRPVPTSRSFLSIEPTFRGLL